MATTLETCKQCGAEFDAQRNRKETFSVSFDPLTRRDKLFLVQCPKCSDTFVSDKVRMFGVITRGRYLLSIYSLLAVIASLHIGNGNAWAE
jgi:predicted nucleic-acid-binding Zn-ribbon protein